MKTEYEICVEFFKRRFPEKSLDFEIKCGYFGEWIRRFESGYPEGHMDSKSLKVWKEMQEWIKDEKEDCGIVILDKELREQIEEETKEEKEKFLDEQFEEVKKVLRDYEFSTEREPIPDKKDFVDEEEEDGIY